MRKPNWKENNSNWGLSKLGNMEIIKNVLSDTLQIADPLINIFLKQKIKKMLHNRSSRCLSLGSGKDIPDGWIGFDRYRKGKNVFPVNIQFKFPLEEESIQAVLAEHILEHFYLDDIVIILQECFRVLEKGGYIRIICPDAKNIARLLMLESEAEKDYDVMLDRRIHRWPQDELNWARTINRLSHQWGQHKSLLTSKMVEDLLLKSGFTNVKIMTVEESHYFSRIPDIHTKKFEEERKECNFVVEGMKK